MKSLALVFSLALGCARGLNGPAQPVTARGAVTLDGPVARAVLVGPAVVHAYMSSSAPALFAAPRVRGTDEDCRDAGASRSPLTRGGADYARRTLELQRDEVLCVVTSRGRTDEVLWHVHGGSGRARALALR
jgi:hypothetical protein